MSLDDLLLTSAQSDQQYSCCLWDYSTLNVHKFYRNGGSTAANCMEIVGRDYILTAEIAKPVLHLWLLNKQDVVKNVRLILPEVANCLAVCPNSIYLAVGINCKVYLWYLPSGKLLSVQQRNYQPVCVIKFSNDGNFLIVGGEDGMLINYCLSDLVTLSSNFMAQREIGKVEPIYMKRDHALAITDIHVGVFGSKARFATVSSDKTCRIYLLEKGELLCNLIFDQSISSVVFDSWFSNIYVGLESGNIRQFNLKTESKSLTHYVGNDSKVITFYGHSNRVVCLSLNAAETILASGSLDCFVYTWDIKRGQLLKRIKHNSPVTNIKFVTSFRNFFEQVVNPQVMIKNLERNIDYSAALVVSQMQTETLDTKYQEFVLTDEISKNDLMEENSRLRSINTELYKAAMLLSTKLYD